MHFKPKTRSCRISPAVAMAAMLCCVATQIHAAGMAVINEFHYNSQNNASLEEFIELHNPGDAPYDLSGHSIADAVTYAFPAGTSIPAGGYLVIAQDPATVQSKFGITGVLGPWTGKLSSGGEEIELRNAANAKVDSVDYKAGFPWPTMADGGGPSAELINPLLDNSKGSSWRSAGYLDSSAAFVPASASGWKYYKGTSEASSPTTAWRQTTFSDTSWLSGQTPIGYGDPGQNTLLSDMYGSYTSVYFRRQFTAQAGAIPSSLTLRVKVDDGCVVWINGTEVARLHVGTGTLAYNSTGINHEADWETVVLTNMASVLKDGTNVIAVHALNTRIDSSDFSFDLELLPYTGSAQGTPGAQNSTVISTAKAPPSISSVSHSPQMPTAGQAVTITAAISDPDGMGAVNLLYQAVDPGSYIRLTDASYATTWTSLPMYDNGTNGDVTANDGIYTVVMPGSLQTHRRLMRYRISFADSLGNAGTVPYSDDETPNFAYFCYNGIPAWSGALRPTAFNGAPATTSQTFPVEVMNSMPAIHMIANSTDIENCQYNSSYEETRFRGTIIQKGIVYDHVNYRIRGQASTYVSGKNKWKINFNRSRDFQAYDNYGRAYAEKWNELPINSNASPWAAMNRGSAGVEESSSHRLYQLAGMAALNTQYFQFRIIDGASESGTDQYSGDLWGLYLGFEPTEGNFLDERGLEDGNLYSIESGAGDLQRQGPTQPSDGSDWTTFQAGVTQTGQTEAWYRANVDLPALYTFLAINRLVGNIDVRPGDNYRFYHRPTDGRWVIIPYDLDMMYIAAHHWGGTMDGVVVAGAPDVFRAIMRHANIAREYRNRCREILSLAGSDGTTSGGQIGQLIAEYANFVNPAGQEKTWADIDAAMWNLNPHSIGSGANTGQTSHKGNFYRALYLDGSRGGLGGTIQTGTWRRVLSNADAYGYSDHEGMMEYLVKYATNTWPTSAGSWSRRAITGYGTGTDSDPNRQLGYGYKYLEFESLYGGWGNANTNPTSANLYNDYPNKPTVSAENPDFTIDNLAFKSTAFSDPQGAGTASAVQWRIARISSPGVPGYVAGLPWVYELESVWTSGELTPGTSFTFPLGVAEVGKRYRVRVRHKDTTGNWSYWSEPVTFDAAAPKPYTLIHYWNFNGSTPLKPNYTLLGGMESVTGAVEYATGQNFAALNARNGDAAGNHQRINNPLTSGTGLVFRIPTTGYKDILLQYETRRSGSGAGTQVIDYSLNGGTSWQNHSSITVADISGTAQVPIIPLDFSSISGARDNPDFTVRITFSLGAGGNVGNNRFDNLTVEGRPITPDYSTWSAGEFSVEEQANAAISGPDADPTGSGITNLMRHALGLGRNESPHTSLGGSSVLPQLQKGASGHVFRFRYNPSATDIVWKVQAGASPGEWTHVLFNSSETPAPAMTDGWVEIPLPTALNGGVTPDPKMFVRLQVTVK
jgi:Lamin Tail Domain/CotH kinase protein